MDKCVFFREESNTYYCDADKSSRRELSDKNYTNKYCENKQMFKKCRLYKELMKNDDENCFITTACVRTKGLPDNCYELNCLRKFRDEYLIKLEEGSTAIEHYYEIAPKIIKNIDKKTNANIIYTNLYNDLVIQCISLIEDNKNYEAFRHYKGVVQDLQNKYL
jgi:hypothetical protein